ncbi:MAG: tRNA glutamyl-Q(34) synthetase GluQRS [Thiomonas sp.]
MSYIGRFAPSPTGPLHAGSLLAALASWLDARAHGGQWLVRIEDVDKPRCKPGADREILRQLAECGLIPDAPVLWQSQRGLAYQSALDSLLVNNRAYACACSKSEIDQVLRSRGLMLRRGEERVYPGTCSVGLGGRQPRAWRLRLPEPAEALVHWEDGRLGAQTEQVDQTVGDFVLKRADGPWAYQLAVVVDDAAQGVSHVVRGEDMAASTARQILLQRALELPTPIYHHIALLHDAQGRKLSKQNGAESLMPGYAAVRDAIRMLGLTPAGTTLGELLEHAKRQWLARQHQATSSLSARREQR